MAAAALMSTTDLNEEQAERLARTAVEGYLEEVMPEEEWRLRVEWQSPHITGQLFTDSMTTREEAEERAADGFPPFPPAVVALQQRHVTWWQDASASVR